MSGKQLQGGKGGRAAKFGARGSRTLMYQRRGCASPERDVYPSLPSFAKVCADAQARNMMMEDAGDWPLVSLVNDNLLEIILLIIYYK